jgi:hypothetical protein
MVYTVVYQQKETEHMVHLAFCLMRYQSLPFAYSDRFVALYIQTHLAVKLKEEEWYFITPTFD